MCRCSVSLEIIYNSISEILSFLNIFTKSSSVTYIDSLFLREELFVSSAWQILRAKLESGASPRLIRGRIISLSFILPSLSLSQLMKRSFANCKFFLVAASSSSPSCPLFFRLACTHFLVFSLRNKPSAVKRPPSPNFFETPIL